MVQFNRTECHATTTVANIVPFISLHLACFIFIYGTLFLIHYYLQNVSLESDISCMIAYYILDMDNCHKELLY